MCHDGAVSRFLLVVLPLQGHLYPMLAIGQELARAGHEVVWCGPEDVLRPLVGPDAVVHATGARAYRRYDESGMAGVRAMWDGYLIPFTRFTLGPVDEAVREHKPDVVVTEQYALAGALVAHRHGVPWATLCTGTLELTPPADLVGFDDYLAEKMAQAVEMAGLSDAPIDPRFSPHLVIALMTAGLVDDAVLPENCVLTGAALGTRPNAPDFPWHRWDADRRHVLVTVGTLVGHMIGDFYDRAAAVLAPLADDVQAIFVTSGVAAESFPDNAITAELVPMLDLMPKLDAVVCHAGGAVNEALTFGVPMVVAPVRAEQVALARQVARSGAGIEVSILDVTVAELDTAVRAVLDEPEYRRHARRIGAEFAAAGGAAAAAAHLVDLACGT